MSPFASSIPYAFDVPLETWAELVVANAFYDRAGFTLLGDVFASTTFGPWKRALVKVDKEETFHLRHGENWMKKICPVGGRSRRTTDARSTGCFCLTVEWFGLPERSETPSEQLGFGFKGKSNDELRQTWMSTAVPLVQGLGLTFRRIWMPKPARTSSTALFPPGSIRNEVMVAPGWARFPGRKFSLRWRQRGPMNEQYVETGFSAERAAWTDCLRTHD